nr:MAG TPA: hypothetical protein [Caudoviricetes sp.]
MLIFILLYYFFKIHFFGCASVASFVYMIQLEFI